MAHIALEHISKRFWIAERPPGRLSALRGAFVRTRREVRALDDLSFSIGEGELVGYIGPNGAGKSTTVKVMSGILTPDEGTCTILGRTPWRERVAHVQHIGVVFGQRSQLWWDVPVQDSFDLLRDIYGIPRAEHAARLDALAQVLDIGGLLRTPVRQLSLGQRMRCEVAAALLHRPRILFLDEPTIGLDAVSKLALRDFLRHINREDGVTMILTTHDMDDIAALCSRVMVIGHGKLLYDGGLNALRATYAPMRVIQARVPGATVPVDIPGAASVSVQGDIWRIQFDPRSIPAQHMLAQIAAVLPLEDLTVEETDADEMIAHMYKAMAI